MGNKTFIKHDGLLWKTFEPMVITSGERNYRVSGPYCPKDKSELLHMTDSEYKITYICGVCNKTYEAGKGALLKADLAWESYRNQDAKVISLDLPPTLVKSEDENKNYWIEARLGQKEGKLMGIVYFGKKTKRKQTKEDYTQIFIDFDDEQLRFDKANKNPFEIIGKLKTEFLGSIQESTKKRK